MELQDLEMKIRELEQEFEQKKRNTIKEYCDVNNPYKIGDKFTDHIGTILIESIHYKHDIGIFGPPCCVYIGAELKKDGTPKKNGNKRKAWQSNDVNLKN
jgi:hypothetical protein